MQYVCLVYQEQQKLAALTDAELDQITSGCMEYIGELSQQGKHVMSSGLQGPGTATTVRRENTGVTMTDGPFAETKECLGGFTIIEARDLSGALQIASKFPTGNLGCIEVRPVMDPFQELTDPLDKKIAGSVRRGIENSAECQEAATAFSNTK